MADFKCMYYLKIQQYGYQSFCWRAISQLMLLIMVIGMLTAGCTSQENIDLLPLEEKEVSGMSLLVPGDSLQEVRAPSEIKAISDGLLVYDYGLEKIFKLDSEGNERLSFGSRGRGPGEFLDVFSFWEFSEGYWIFDYSSTKFIEYDREGNWLEDHPITFEGFPDSPTRVEVINPQQFVIGSGGKKGSLFTLVDIKTKDIQHFGKSVSKYANYNPEAARKAISSGRIPAGQQNEVLLGSNQSGIFSLQQTTAVLEKYSHDGELIWQQGIKIPAIEDLFDRLFEENRRRINRDDFLLEFIYGRRMSANEKGVAILLNTLEDQPVTVAWVPNDGQQVTAVSFPEMDNDLLGLTFTISTDGSYIYFSDALDGELYRAEWPL
ncbi:hypothetical protein [Fodinibius salsisoli]|uniref:6-bladed beta-propeller n=1 Tax=Fodinibius salsisoli TaxID=2820877 RepID=A0ABT3PJQ0_9BACT|nr:hypothetical protein [Fodinibius salsisoli]MCW9706170.1 hypothetical protein [Fodinibius salsisoli]